jgi:hypothetical protein
MNKKDAEDKGRLARKHMQEHFSLQVLGVELNRQVQRIVTALPTTWKADVNFRRSNTDEF